jgi:hypothetical protein
MISIDMPAGPSEVLVIADRYANPVHVASDLLSQVLALKCFFSFLMEHFHSASLMLLPCFGF